MRIRNTILLTILLSLVVILGSGYWAARQHLRGHQQELSREYLAIVADNVRNMLTQKMAAGATAEELQETLAGIRLRNSDIVALSVFPAEAVVRQFHLPGLFPESEGARRHDFSREEPLLFDIQEGDRKISHFHYPIHSEKRCLQCHRVEVGQRMGTLLIDVDVTDIEQTLQQNGIELLVLNLVQLVLFLLAIAVILHRLLFSRLESLLHAVHSVAKGNYQLELQNPTNDEIGRIFKAFVGMAEKIRSLLYARDEYIREQTNQLSFLQQMSNLLARSQAIDEMLDEFAETFTHSVHVTCTRIALLDESKEVLSVRSVYPLRDVAAGKDAKLSCQKTLCPLLWETMETKQYRLIDDPDTLSQNEKGLLDIEKGLTALCVPIAGKEEIHGIIVLVEQRDAKREPLDDSKARFCMALAQQLGAAIENGHLQDRLVEQSEQAVLAMAEAVDKKSPWTAGHSQRVTDLAVRTAQTMGWSADKVEELRMAGLLHDIGKIGTPEGILDKETRLSKKERDAMKKHPVDGAQIIGRIRRLSGIVPAVLHHHEFFNGSGYPDGLKGKKIPIGARILAVADAYDAIVSDRPYRKGLPHEEAIKAVRKAAGTQFDPEVVEAFVASFGG